MSDSKDLELDRLLTCGLEELIAAVRPMSAQDCVEGSVILAHLAAVDERA